MWIVIESTRNHLKLWNGEDKDEWLKPSFVTLEGDYCHLKPDTLVEIIVREVKI